MAIPPALSDTVVMKRLFLLAVIVVGIPAAKLFADSEGDVAAAPLLALTNQAVIIDETSNKFQMDQEKPKNVSMFTLSNAVVWTADMDIDSDGRETPLCNKKRDPWHQSQLSCGTDIAADETPYFVIPIGKPANYRKRGIEIGQVAAIVYSNQVAYAIFLDECGDRSLIGEASIATANILGIDADPKTGGTDGPVTYIVFTGESGRITDPKDYADHKKVIEIGNRRAKELLTHYGATNAIAAASAPAK